MIELILTNKYYMMQLIKQPWSFFQKLVELLRFLGLWFLISNILTPIIILLSKIWTKDKSEKPDIVGPISNIQKIDYCPTIS